MEPVVEAVAAQFRDTHQKIREAIAGLGSEALNWSPVPEANSIAVLVIHTLGSEADTLHVVRGLPSDRDRPAEFRSRVTDPAELQRRLDDADKLLDDMASTITAEDLATPRVRASSMSMPDPHTGTFWLVQNCTHAREHLGHIALTRQWWESR